MAEALSREQARAQAWEMLLVKAKAAQDADPKAVAAAKTLLEDPAWKDAIEADVTAPTFSETAGKAVISEPHAPAQEEHAATEIGADGLPDGYIQVPWDVKYPGYIGGSLAFGADFDEERTERGGTLVIEDIGWGSA